MNSAKFIEKQLELIEIEKTTEVDESKYITFLFFLHIYFKAKIC